MLARHGTLQSAPLKNQICQFERVDLHLALAREFLSRAKPNDRGKLAIEKTAFGGIALDLVALLDLGVLLFPVSQLPLHSVFLIRPPEKSEAFLPRIWGRPYLLCASALSWRRFHCPNAF